MRGLIFSRPSSIEVIMNAVSITFKHEPSLFFPPCMRSADYACTDSGLVAVQLLSSIRLSAQSAVHRCSVTATSGEKMILSIAMCREERHKPSYR